MSNALPLSHLILNAVENLDDIKRIINRTRSAALPILLNTPGTAAIAHLRHLSIQRTGTPLQLALFSDDEDVIAYLKTVMNPEEFERQSKEVFRNALSPEKQAELDAKNAPALEYYNAMLIAQKVAAEKLCHSAFQFDAVNNRLTVTKANAADFQKNLENYVRNNPIHNPFILHCLYEIYNKLPEKYYSSSEIFSGEVIGYAQALSSARWLQHYVQGMHRLSLIAYRDRSDWGLEWCIHRSFVCRDSYSAAGGVDVRSFIPTQLGVDSCMDMFGELTQWIVLGMSDKRSFEEFLSIKNSKLKNIVTQQTAAHRQCVIQ